MAPAGAVPMRHEQHLVADGLDHPAAVRGDDVGGQRLEPLHHLGELALGQAPYQRGERHQVGEPDAADDARCGPSAGSASATMREMAAVRCRRHA